MTIPDFSLKIPDIRGANPHGLNQTGTSEAVLESQGFCVECGQECFFGVSHECPERAGREGDSQPLPVINDAPDVQSAVIADIEKRRELGIKRYGTALQPNNGRNALLDAYEEAIDLAMYLKQRLIEDGIG